MKIRDSVIGIEKLEERLRFYEDKYGVPSECLDSAFRDRETFDFRDWTILYAAYRRLPRPHPPQKAPVLRGFVKHGTKGES